MVKPAPRGRCVARFVFLVCLLGSTTAGCVLWSGPPRGSLDFAEAQSLSALDGVYRNIGEGGEAAFPIALSGLLWPHEQLDPNAIETVEIRAVGADTVVARAHGNAGILRESTFVAGRDFHFEHGRIRIMQTSALLNQAPDDPLVGPRTEARELGIDVGGAGKYRSTARAIGLVYLFLPVVMNITEEARFPKVAE